MKPQRLALIGAIVALVTLVPTARAGHLLTTSPLTASLCSAQAPPSPPKGERGLPSDSALVLLDAADLAAMDRIVARLEARGGRAIHFFPPQAIIGQVPLGVEDTAGLRAVYRGVVDVEELAARGDEVRQAAVVWNGLLAPEVTALEGKSTTAQPLVGDVRTLDVPPTDEGSKGLGVDQVAEFLAGKVAVGIITVESNGEQDPSTENWDTARLNQVEAEIVSGLTWWASVASGANVQYVYDIHRQAPTKYEPINHSWDDDGPWIADVLGRLGYTDSTWWQRVRSYLNAIRIAKGTDWAVVAFVVDSKNDPDGAFTCGHFAYTWFGGGLACIIMTYDNDGWGISNMNNIMAHEFGHCFGACDEYGGCSCSSICGYLGVANSRCHTCKPANCLMRTGSYEDFWPAEEGICSVSKAQVGLRDSDGDGVPDVIDTAYLTVAVAPPPVTTDTTPTFEGVANDQPYDSPVRPDVSINYIASVEYRVDGGAWLQAQATDGAYGQTTERFTLTTAPLADGAHTVTIRARGRFANYSSPALSTFVVDTAPPSSSVQPLRPQSRLPLGVRWSGQDAGGIATYDVQYRDGAGGVWTDWLLNTTASSAGFLGEVGHTYYFRCRARDVVGHQEEWPTNPDYDAVTTVTEGPLRCFVPLVLR